MDSSTGFCLIAWTCTIFLSLYTDVAIPLFEELYAFTLPFWLLAVSAIVWKKREWPCFCEDQLWLKGHTAWKKCCSAQWYDTGYDKILRICNFCWPSAVRDPTQLDSALPGTALNLTQRCSGPHSTRISVAWDHTQLDWALPVVVICVVKSD